MAAPIDSNIQSISLHKSIPIVLHGYIWPFMVAYALWLYFWVVVYGTEDYWEPGLIALAGIGIVQILVCLSCYWSVHIRARLACLSVSMYWNQDELCMCIYICNFYMFNQLFIHFINFKNIKMMRQVNKLKVNNNKMKITNIYKK